MKRTITFVVVLCACGKPTAQAPTPDHGGHSGHDGHAGHEGHAQEPPATPDPQRGAHLSISCGAEAQALFDRGFFFLHNMDYARARSTFEDASTKHSKCAMLYWGAAMTYFQPLWAGQPTADALRRGATAVEKARSASATPVEREYVDAVGAFYDNWEKTDSAARLKNWAAGQKRVADHYPDDIEAQAFSALARLATLDKKDKTYAESIAVGQLLEQLLQKRPEHPGLMHYLLHAYDNPALAQHGVDIAHKYAVTSPDAAHALHMPSHILVRLGDWKGVVASNIDSAAAALKHPAADRISRDFIHATDYLTYGYLQMADDDNAKAAVGKIDPAAAYELNNGPGAYGLAAAPARFALERRMWKEAAGLAVRKVPYSWDQYPWAEAVTHAARGLGAARSGDLKSAQAALAELERLKPLIESPWWKSRVQIDHDVVAAWLAHARKSDKQAEQLMRAAADQELADGKDSVEPGHVIPAIEELGDLLLELKRPKDALAAFERALKESPKRFNALFGAGRAAELAGQKDQAKTYYTELVELGSASATRPALAPARKFLGR